MAKAKISAFVCQDCGADYSKWQGQCTECGTWNTLTEVRLGGSGVSKHDQRHGFTGVTAPVVQLLSEIDVEALPRLSTEVEEFDRVLGGGLVPASVVLIGGDPGAGKSTLVLDTLCNLAAKHEALYVTGEESLQQVAMRAKRLALPTDKLKVLSETNINNVIYQAEQQKPTLMVIDSIQVMYSPDIQSAPGGVSQVRECAAFFTRFAKQTGTVVVLVGHVTKDGSLAGPKVLEHMIDCSIMLEGSNDSRYRTLRSYKNRFGAVNELGVFAMTEQGLKEVSNPSAIFLQRPDDIASGSVVMVIWEGTRPLLVEVQALVDESSLGNPRRVAVGVDHNRIAMLLAVLHRHGGVMVSDKDVFVNVVGGVKVMDTSADLAVLLSLASSLKDQALPSDLIVFGEVGLSGELRPVLSGQERLREAAKHGFKRAIVPLGNVGRGPINGMEVVGVKKLSEALDAI